MIEIIPIKNNVRWDSIVKSFLDWDVYYLSGYVKAFQLHGDGTPFLLYFQANDLRAIYVYMKRPTIIPDCYDSITPYGYGGVLFNRKATDAEARLFWDEYLDAMKKENIVDNFVRYHPLLFNAIQMKGVSDVIDLGHTIAMDLSSESIIWNNLTSKNRNMIRKAEKSGIVIKHGTGKELFENFIRIYNGTMIKDNAEEYYFFKQSFYNSILQDLPDNYEIFYAELNELIISMSIILYGNGRLHYHLSGSLAEYRHLAPSNLLLYKVALWGCERGYSIFHLGGGIGSGEDNLYKFKASFNRNSDYRFSIGKMIFDRDKYQMLIDKRRSMDQSFNQNSAFFPLYRS